MINESEILARLQRAEAEAQRAAAAAKAAERSVAELKRGFVGEGGVEVNYPVVSGGGGTAANPARHPLTVVMVFNGRRATVEIAEASILG